MNSKLLWNDQIPERDGVRSPINDIAVSPDGTKIIAAVGNRVLLYKADNGDLIESLRGHKDTVYSVAFSSDGTRFASGGADHIVVIWKSTGQGLLKYNHTAPIQRVSYNPSMLLLASCSDVDFGLWTPEQKQVTKEKVPSRITSCAWSVDGSMLALGMINGTISIRNQQAEEIQKFERRAPIWCMVFIPDFYPAKQGVGANASSTTAPENSELLAIGCWDKTYSLYRVNSNSNKLQTEKQLKYYPCSMSYAVNQTSKSTYVLISGSNRKVTLYSREGMKLSEVYQKDSWIWSCSCHGDSDTIAMGSNLGSIDLVQMKFNMVHTLFKDRYSYRENLTEVIVHHLTTDKKVRIKCKDLIHNLSLFKNKLAVQLSDRVSVYESSADRYEDMHFRLRKEKILINIQSLGDVKSLPENQSSVKSLSTKSKASLLKDTLIVITSSHLLFSRGSIIELFAFDGQRQRLWTLDSKVNCMRVDGGLEDREGVYVGLQSGNVKKLYIDNLFPIDVLKLQNGGVSQLDVNLYRTILACVSTTNQLSVIDMRTQEVLHTIADVTAVSFNTEVEDIVCITGIDGSISVVSGISTSSLVNSGPDTTSKSSRKSAGMFSPEIQEQHIFGLGLGFRGQRIFCLYKGSVVGVDVPQGLNMLRALENSDIATAYKIACLGATEADWKLLAMRALRANDLTTAKNSFARLKDIKFLTLIDEIERRGGQAVVKSGVGSDSSSTVSTAAGIGASRSQRHTNLGVAESAQSKNHVQHSTLIAQPLEPMWQAELMAYEGHHHEAAKIYARSGKLDEAIRLFTDLRRWEDAKMFARNAGQADISVLTLQQAQWLQEINDWKGSSDLYTSLGQHIQAAKIIAEAQKPGWQDALLEVVRSCPADNVECLDYCGDKFSSSAQDTTFAKEAFVKAKDISKLMSLYAKRQMWKEAAVLAEENEGKFDVSIFLSYAEWLVSQDRYEEAMQAYKKSHRIDLAKKVLEELTTNAVSECRFKDAAYYYWMLSRETEGASGSMLAVGVEEHSANDSIKNLTPKESMSTQYEYEHKADLYYAYANIHSFVTDPFTSQQPEMLFQVSRFILNSLGSADSVPLGVSKASTLFTLARQSMLLGAFKLARHAYERLHKLQIPEKKIEEIEIDMLLVQAKPIRDDPDHLPVCYRCSSTNPLLNPFTNNFAKGDVCTNCGHPFVRSFINFDILPLVEFVPEPSITDEEAIEYIRQPPPSRMNGNDSFYGTNADSKVSRGENTTIYGKKKGWKESKGGGADRLTLDDDEGSVPDETNAHGASEDVDPFTRCLNNTLNKQKNKYTPVKVDVATLERIKRSEVFVCRPSSSQKRATFYKNMLPDIPIAISQPCHRFFHLEDFEFTYLSEQKCPYSRLKNIGEYGSL